MTTTRGLHYRDARPTYAQSYLWPVVIREIERLGLADKRAFDLGCGNGSLAGRLIERSYLVAGVDPSPSGIAQAKAAFPQAASSSAPARTTCAGASAPSRWSSAWK